MEQREKKITILHAVNVRLVVDIFPDRNICNDMAYLVPDRESFSQIARNMYQLEKERSEWIRRYENVLTGLNYWKQMALHKS